MYRTRLWATLENRFDRIKRGTRMFLAIGMIAFGGILVAVGGILLQQNWPNQETPVKPPKSEQIPKNKTQNLKDEKQIQPEPNVAQQQEKPLTAAEKKVAQRARFLEQR